jgi:hypothetical protein
MNLEQNKFKTITIGTRVTAIQKKIYLEIAQKNNLCLSEWIFSLLQMYSNGYESYGKPNSEMIAKEEVIEKLHLKIKSLKKDRNNDFQTIQYLINKIDHLENRLNFAKTFSAIKTQHIDMLNDEIVNS